MRTRPVGGWGTWATPCMLVLTLSSVFLSLINRSSCVLRYTLAFSIGLSASPPVISIVRRGMDAGAGGSFGGADCCADAETHVARKIQARQAERENQRSCMAVSRLCWLEMARGSS